MDIVKECRCTVDEKELKKVLKANLGEKVGCLGKMSSHEKKAAVLASLIVEMRSSQDLQGLTFNTEDEKQKDIKNTIEGMQERLQELEDDKNKEEYLINYARGLVLGMPTEKSREHIKKYINLFAQIDSDWARKVIKRLGFNYNNIVKK